MPFPLSITIFKGQNRRIMKGRIFTPEEEALLGKVGVTVTVQPGGVV